MRLLVPGTLALALLITSCSSDKESATQAAARLADALSSGRAPVDLFGSTDAQTAYDGLTAGLGEVTPTVEVAGVAEEEAAATATLSWTWDLDGYRWTYDASADLTEGDAGWQVAWSPTLVEPTLVDGETLDVASVPAERADILGADGAALVTERPVVRFGLDKTKVPAARAVDSARRLAGVLDVSPGPFVRAVRAAGDAAFVEAIVLRRPDARRVDPAYADIRGAVALDGRLPLAPTREFAAPILGRVGPATAEIIADSDGRLQVGDDAGLSGLEARYDAQLAGTPGVVVSAVEQGGGTRRLFADGPVKGEPLATSLDEQAQLAAERVLADGPTDSGTALVAVRPSTGEILAAASGPGAGGQNLATYGQYAPGSTFKLVSSLALLRSGLTPQSPVSCPATTVVDGKQFKNYDDYPATGLGRITLRQAVANSCNTAFIGQRDRLEPGDLADAAASLGLGVDADLGFPAYFGQVPPASSETEAAADLIGQGKVLASPMAMATVAASVAAGRTVVPHLLDDQAPDADPSTPLSAAEAAELRGLMRAVVTDGSGSLLADLPGEVGAKTGTAEYGDPGPGGALPTHAWMVATQGDLAVAVFVETGDSGSGTAGPLLRAFLTR